LLSVFWFRRDLRLHDNAGLYHALKGPHPVLPLFIFDRAILDALSDRKDARVTFIHHAIERLKQVLEAHGSSLLIRYGQPEEVWQQLLNEYPIASVYTNRDYETYAIQRDANVQLLLQNKGIGFHTFKDHVIFEKNEVLKDDGTPYTVFTPYSRKWMARLNARMEAQAGEPISFYLKSYPASQYHDRFFKTLPLPDIALSEMGFEPSALTFPPTEIAQGIVKNYDQTRNFPAIQGTTRLGIHFRFGTISIREKARRALALNATFLNELIWRDFYSQILAHFPHVEKEPFRLIYNNIAWRHAPEDFEKWKQGKTGYPIVDAGMRELNATGYMHNRVRMIVASFLSKHLLLDWRLGEAYFAEKLLDFDLASNSGGWQWAAGCGTDAAPYFRIFNPTEQAKKFDPEYKYIRRWVPEFGTSAYPKPMVDHALARERCLDVYKTGLGRG
jgi:deoxyribodipyrimidine photo-lyase